MIRALPLLFLAACAAPDTSELFHDAVVTVVENETDVNDAFIEAIEEATVSLHIALPAAGDAPLYEALLAKWQAVRDQPGFVYELVVDVDMQGDPGVAALLSADAPVRLADGELTYFEFTLNETVTWSSDQAIMSHAYAIVDERRVVAATTAGDRRLGPRVLFELRGEDLIDDLWIEHNQVFGGSDAVAVTAFDAPAKSIADFRWMYPTTGDHMLEMWFGPQERTTKRVIDAVYGARSGIWIVADDIANEGLALALKEKARWGFDVRVVVGPGFRSSSRALSDLLGSDPGEVQLVQVDDGIDQLPSIVLVDVLEDREGYSPKASGMVLTHPLVSSARLYRRQPVVTDQLIDGALWVVTDTTPDREALLPLTGLFQDLFETGRPL